MRRMIGWMALVACAGATACTGPRQMTDDFGKANGAWRDMQVVNRGVPAQAVSGLDSEEAAIIAKAYRRSLDAKGQQSDHHEQQVMLLQRDEQGRMQAKPLAPSVPKE